MTKNDVENKFIMAEFYDDKCINPVWPYKFATITMLFIKYVYVILIRVDILGSIKLILINGFHAIKRF